MWKAVGVVAAVCLIVIIAVPAGIALLIGSPDPDPVRTVTLTMYDHNAQLVRTMTLQEYLVGVVAAEMPASFGYEALKAQAVAARTYTLRKITLNQAAPVPDHHGAQMCSDPAHCQAWCSREELLRRWGVGSYVVNIRKIIGAVADTDGLVITYKGELIDAVYHASCGGTTEDAAEVWGRRIPYLTAVSCEYEDRSKVIVETKTVTQAELLAALGLGRQAVPAMSSGVRVATRTATDRAGTLSIYGVGVSATDVRKALGLRSTMMTVRSEAGRVSFTTVGYGHGVGMCQRGADGMAAAGKTFDEILCHYYSGVQIQRIGPTTCR